MDKKKEEFLAKLRETFLVEAAEHIEAITTGLMAVEHAAEDARAVIVEGVFREAHSLKGAARSVSLAAVEALCSALESVFAAAKSKTILLSTETLDMIHPAVAVIAALCANPDDPVSPECKEKGELALAGLKRIARGAAGGPVAASKGAAAPVIDKPHADGADPVSHVAVPAPGAARPAAAETVRVSVQKLGSILLDAEELVGARIAAGGRTAELRALAADVAGWNRQRLKAGARRRKDGGSAGAELLESELLYTRALESSLRKLVSSAQHDSLSLASITDRLLDGTKNLLLFPCSHLLGPLPAVLRDLAHEQGKEADLAIVGEDIEIDRRVLDELRDPLVHLLRNAVDHAVEKPEVRLKLGKPVRANLTITARSVESNRIEFMLTDDGAGIDIGKVRDAAVRLGLATAADSTLLSDMSVGDFVFHSGLSTSPMITDLSGRGLGLAIVREKVEKLGGEVSVTSTPGIGTTFRILVPVSLSTFRGVVVETAARSFIIPTASVVRVCSIRSNEIKTVENRETISEGERAVSLVRLRDVLGLPGPDRKPQDHEARPAVIVRAADHHVAFLVDEVQGEQEVMAKSLGRQLVRIRNLSGAAISGTGAIVPILNALDLVESARSVGAPRAVASVADTGHERHGRLLVAEDSITARTLLKSILEGAGYDVVVAVDGIDALTKLKTGQFDGVVSDVDMPRMSGFELTARIRADKKLSDIPVVLVTALGSQKDREYGVEVGANAYIVKSDFDQGDLLEVVARLV